MQFILKIVLLSYSEKFILFKNIPLCDTFNYERKIYLKVVSHDLFWVFLNLRPTQVWKVRKKWGESHWKQI